MEPPTCQRCGNTYVLRDGCEPSPECDSCAHVALAEARSLLQQMLDVAENADETGYVTDVGFVDLEKLHEEVRAALKS